MGVEVAGGAVDLAQHLDLREARARALQPVGDVGHLLAERGGRGGLAVRAREHRPRRRARAASASTPLDDGVDRRQQDAVAATPDHARVGEVVDVLGGAGEVDELGGGGDLGVAGEALAQPVLDRLHVVVGGRLDRLDALGVGEAEGGGGALELGARRGGEGLQRRESGLVGERQQPGDLDGDALAHQRELAEVILQGPSLGGVAPVEGREGGEGGGHCGAQF